MTRRWKFLVLVLALGLPSPGLAEDLRQQSSRDWDARGLKRLEVENPSGDITLRPSLDGGVHLVALKVIRHPDRKGAEQLSRDTQLLAEQESGVLRINVRYANRRQVRITVLDLMRHVEWPEVDMRLALEVPAGLQVALRTASGDLQTNTLAGHQELTSSSGDIDVIDARGALSIECRSGDVTVDRVDGPSNIATTSGSVVVGTARGALAVDSRSGDIRVDSATESVTLSTGSGNVRVGFARLGLDVQSGSGDVIARASGRVRVESSSGETKVALTAPLQAAEFASGSGDVMLRLGPGIECRIDAEASSGDVEVNLPLVTTTSKDNHVIGLIGRGSTAINIRASSGSINVAR